MNEMRNMLVVAMREMSETLNKMADTLEKDSSKLILITLTNDMLQILIDSKVVIKYLKKQEMSDE